jgi:hypothetical protein
MALTNGELADMRAAIQQLLPDTCNLLSPTHSPDGMGGEATAWGTVGTALACRLDVSMGREVLAGGAVRHFVSYMLSLPYDTTVEPTYRVEAGSSTFAVKSVNLEQSWSAVRRVELERIE